MTTAIVQGFQLPDDKSFGLSWIQKDPDDVKDYERDWTPHLATGELVASAQWLLFTSASPPVALTGALGELALGTSSYAPSIDGTSKKTKAWLNGGTAGKSYIVTCRATTDSTPPRIIDVSFQVRCIQR
jgi:hypothetical protein